MPPKTRKNRDAHVAWKLVQCSSALFLPECRSSFVCRDLHVNAKVTFFLLSQWLLTETPSTLPSQQWQSTNLSQWWLWSLPTEIPHCSSWILIMAFVRCTGPPKVVTEKLTVIQIAGVELNWLSDQARTIWKGEKRLRLKKLSRRTLQ